MTTYDFVHLVLLASGGRMSGRTKLQKTVYFTGVLTNRADGLGFRAHYYGPYSPDVSAAIDDLRGLGFLTQRIASGNAVDSRGFEIARYDYELTDDGRLIAEDKAAKYPDLWTRIRAAVAKLAAAKAEDYVKLSVAAKSFFMSKTKTGVMTPEERSRQSSEFGWAVPPEEFREADELLRSIGLLTPEPAR